MSGKGERGSGNAPSDGIGEGTQQFVANTLAHADDLLAGAKRLLPEFPHLAYHLAALALEEVGRATLFVMMDATGEDAPGLVRALDDHVRKLFWAIWGPSFGRELITGEQIAADRGLARQVHEQRKAGLYFDPNGPLPRAAVNLDEATRLIAMTEARIGLERSHRFGPLDGERAADVRWFVARTSNPERRREVLSRVSMDRLVELGSVPKWVHWLRTEAEEQERSMLELAQRELDRSVPEGGVADEPKWRFTQRLVSGSHSIRGKALATWNKNVESVKLAPAGRDHRELLVTVTLSKRVSASALYGVGLALTTDLALAFNIGTNGLFWWYLVAPAHSSRFYEELRDLETNAGVVVERTPALRINWGKLALTEHELALVARCFGAMRRAGATVHEALEHYRIGVVLLVKTDIFLQFEPNAFEEFYTAVKLTLKTTGEWDGSSPVREAVRAFIARTSATALSEAEGILAKIDLIEAGRMADVPADLSDVGMMKLLADAVLLRALVAASERPPADATTPTSSA